MKIELKLRRHHNNDVSLHVNGEQILWMLNHHPSLTTEMELPSPGIQFSDLQAHVGKAIDASVLMEQKIADATGVWVARSKELSAQVDRRDRVIEEFEAQISQNKSGGNCNATSQPGGNARTGQTHHVPPGTKIIIGGSIEIEGGRSVDIHELKRMYDEVRAELAVANKVDALEARVEQLTESNEDMMMKLHRHNTFFTVVRDYVNKQP